MALSVGRLTRASDKSASISLKNLFVTLEVFGDPLSVNGCSEEEEPPEHYRIQLLHACS